MHRLTSEDIAKFHAAVIKRGPDECWGWLCAHDKGGYPLLYPARGRCFRAHRIASYLEHGFAGACTCHTCNNPGCVNPKHLYPGDNKTNATDRDLAGRHGKSKTTHEQTLTIAAMYRDGKSASEISAALGFPRQVVYRICKGKTFGWLTGFEYTRRHLTPEDVLQVVTRYRSGEGVASIASDLGVSHDTIWNICAGRIWRNITGL